MKKFLTLFVLFLSLASQTFAGAPAFPASNLTFSGLDGASFTGNFTNGGGANRIIVMKEGSPVTGLPVNGIDYVANAIFGTAAAKFTGTGEYVVAKTGWSSFTPTNLKPGTVYYVAIFEFNGSGTGTEYLMLPLTGSQSTVIAPTTQVSSITSTGATGNTITLNFAKGNGTGRVVVARKGSPVNATPPDLVIYWADQSFGSGTKFGTDNYVVYKGTGTSVVVKNLEPNTTYYFEAFEYNGSASPMHLAPGATFSAITNAGPTIAPSSPGFNYIEGNSYTIAVAGGNGTRRLFIIKKGSPVTASPVTGVNYTASAVFGAAGSEIAPGEYVVSASTGTSVNITNLEPNTTYHFRVYEYDVDAANTPYYLTSAFAVKSGSTAVTPSSIATNLNTSSLTGSSASVTFTPGNGSYRMVIMKAGAPVDAAPVNLTRYSANSAFGSGQQIAPGNYVMHFGINGAVFPVTNLQPGTTYYISIYEFNGNTAPVYSNTGAVYSFTVPLEPTSVATAPWTAFVEGSSFRLIWNNGNGGKRIVIAKKGSAVTARPVDRTIYTANAGFGQGYQIASNEFVVFNGTSNEVNLTGLEIGANYHFAVFEYNTASDGSPDYLTTSWLATNFSTITWPTTQTVISSVSGVQATQATINFTKGNGASRMFIMKQGAPVTVDPQDLVKYTYSTVFGTSSALMSDGNYVIAIVSGTGNFTVTGLQPNTTYHINAYEFNGSNEPAYLRTAPAKISFTTPDAPGAITPTTAASNAVVNNVDGNKFTFKWTNGNGEKRIVVMKKGSPVTFVPSNATSYSANASFGSGTDLGNGQYVVLSSNGNTVDVTNLEPSATYHFAVYEYSGTGSLLRYLTTQSLSATAATSSAPTTPTYGVVTTTGSAQLTFGWMNGNGAGRIIVMKEGSAVTAIPSNLNVYPANATFKLGTQMAAGEYVVYAGASTSVTVTGLENKTYYYRVFEYNGSTAPVYNTTAIVAGSAVVSSTLPVKLLHFTVREQNGKAMLQWATSQEMNSNHFAVERSVDGSNFSEIRKITAAGNSNNTVNYVYVDENTVKGTLYYRLKQVDNDGNFTYSSVINITVKGEGGSISIYPNPVKDRFRLSLPANVPKAALIVYDSKGIIVHRQEVTNGQYVNASGWSGGTYYVVVQANGKVYESRVVKQ
jgi:hypothetical protein